MINWISNNYTYVNVFFLFSFLGWIMECIVIKIETGVLENRGFAKGPFCVIYGMGAAIGSMILQPFVYHKLMLYIIGAMAATVFEYITGRLMIKLFGDFWWDYSEKKFNYKGIICLESTIGWGVVAVLIVGYIYDYFITLFYKVPVTLGKVMAVSLILGYAIDFGKSFRNSRKKYKQDEQEGMECILKKI